MLTGADSDKDQVNHISSQAQMVRSSLLKVSGFNLIKLILWSFGKSLDTAQTFKFDIEY